MTVLVSGGADSTCLWHVLRELGYEVSALHVDHGLRGEESDEDARFCREVLGAEVVDERGGTTEEELRTIRYSFATDRLRATGHALGPGRDRPLPPRRARRSARIEAKRADGVVRPLLSITREETQAYCRSVGLPFRTDTSNSGTKRGLIRERILPLLRELHPAAEENLLALLDEGDALHDLLAGTNVTRGSISAAARQPSASTTRSGSSDRPCGSTAKRCAGASGASAPPTRSLR